jgi:hypothetical protein
MRIAYLTTVEVNKDQALRLAAQWEVTVCPVEPRDRPPDGQFDALLYDWDHWPADQRPRTLTPAPAGPLRQPVALHSYGLEPHQARALRRSGVLVFDRLESRTFLDLVRAVHQARPIREQEETVDLSHKGNGATAGQAEAEAPPPEPARNGPSCCQPGYTGKLDPPLPPLQPAGDGHADLAWTSSPGFAANGRRKVFRHRCLRCREQAQGKAYRFAVVHSPTPGDRIVREVTAFICNRCAEARLRRRAWLVLLTGVPLGLLAFGGWFALAVSIWLDANPPRRGSLPAVGVQFLVSFGLLVLTGLLVRLAGRHLRWVRGKGYPHERFPDAAVTRMAIELRKKEILSRLHLPEASVRFLVPCDRRDMTDSW